MEFEDASYGGTKIQSLTFKEHAKKRSMWLGSAVVSAHEAWMKQKGHFEKIEGLKIEDPTFQK